MTRNTENRHPERHRAHRRTRARQHRAHSPDRAIALTTQALLADPGRNKLLVAEDLPAHASPGSLRVPGNVAWVSKPSDTAGMSDRVLPGQFRVVLPDGHTIERLPLGLAHDAWHLVFIGWPTRDFTSDEVRARSRSPLSDGITAEAIGGE